MTMEKIEFGKRSIARTRHRPQMVIRNVEWLPDGHDLVLACHSYGSDDRSIERVPASPVGIPRPTVTAGSGALLDALAKTDHLAFAVSSDGRQAVVPKYDPGGVFHYRIHLVRPGGSGKVCKGDALSYPDDLQFSPSGKHVFAKNIYTTYVWDADGRRLAAIDHLADNFGYGFDEDAKTIYSPLVSCSNTNDKLRRWGRLPGVIERFRLADGKYPEAKAWAEQPKVKATRLHPGGAWLAAYGHGEVRSWEVPSGKALGSIKLPKGRRGGIDFEEFRGSEYVSLDFNRSGDLLIVTDGNRVAICRAFAEGGLEPLGRIDLGTDGGGTRVRARFSPTTDVFYAFQNCGMHGGHVTTVDLTPLTSSFHR